MKAKLAKNKLLIAGIIGIVVLSAIFNGEDENNPQESVNGLNNEKVSEIKEVICDGITITEDCELDGIQYSLYKYYPAVEEKSHIEKITTYKKEIIGYCTLCKDGTYSPTCATGKGACSRHGGVAQRNAPIYREVPQYEEKKIIDSPAVAEKYEKIIKEN